MDKDRIVPDSTVTTDDRNKYGYKNEGMLPLRAKTAYELHKRGLTIFKLYPNNYQIVIDETPAESLEESTFINEMLYGIKISDWENFLEGFSKQVLITCTDQDGLDCNYINLLLHVKPEMDMIQIFSAIKDASLEYCLTEEGRKTYEGNCNNFNYGDFDAYVPNDICLRHGILKIDYGFWFANDDFNTQLVSENDVFPEEDEE